MKKFLQTATVALVFALFTITSGIWAFAPAGSVEIHYATPKIDGNVSAGEWPSESKLVITADNATAGGWIGEVPAENKIETYWAWDESNLYIAAVITDPEVSYSESGGNYNMDAFQVSLNLGYVFKSADYNRAIFYTCDLLEDGTVDVFRQESADNAVIDDLGVSQKTDKGWTFELAMPWSMLVEDVEMKAGETVEIAPGLKIGGLVCYLDHDETGALINAYATSNTDTVGWDPDAFGIDFTLVKVEEPAPEESPAEPETTAEPAPAEAVATAPATLDPATASFIMLAASASVAAVLKKRK